ncbi:phage integrase SAM-like domain-containing protein [uncultured Duncaniella sp.]|uniref:phage integrase SAM-like domain-containing protein n=1 Tax=uncultured Duncaniella sp. TaxID=2768039 RepID=UPI002607300A|nr:phage integrase SAM-like domain-containing protein [uncultured Duncaniella sp.]
MDICTKVTLRQRLLPSGKITLYLDYYPVIRNPKTNRSQRHEYMGIYLYGNPTNQVQRNFNKTMLEKAELIRCRRQEQVINRQFGFIDHTQQREDFLAYFEGVCKKRYEKWKIVFIHFCKFTGGKCTFGDVTVDLCTRFREYLLTAKQLKHTEKTVSRSASDTRRDYENRIGKLDRWYEDNAEAIVFGEFYRENFPKQYRDWQTGGWQQDIALPRLPPPRPLQTPLFSGGIIL